MKPINNMKTLKESILSDVDKTLSVDNAYTKIYPTPKVRDFVKHPWGGVQVDWICPNLIQEYIDILDPRVMDFSYFSSSHKESIIGFIFVMEVLSVMLQVGSFKLRGKRIFLMAPLHHHFEQNTHEVKVVSFYIIVSSVIGLLTITFYLRG